MTSRGAWRLCQAGRRRPGTPAPAGSGSDPSSSRTQRLGSRPLLFSGPAARKASAVRSRRQLLEARDVGDRPHVALEDRRQVVRQTSAPAVSGSSRSTASGKPPRTIEATRSSRSSWSTALGSSSSSRSWRSSAPGRPASSASESGQSVRTSIRPASASATSGMKSGFAEPVRRNRPGRRSRSTAALIGKKTSGARCTSSMMLTRPGRSTKPEGSAGQRPDGRIIEASR